MTIQELHQLFLESNGVTTDTRNITPNAMFFALKGENFNGNKYAEKAIELGAKYAIVDDESIIESEKIIYVENTLVTLQKLAKFHRSQFNIPVIGITGSNGKTTSKELINAVLSQKYNVLVTQGNFNNHLGVPFTLLNINKTHEVAIVEMGANKPGDIKELAEIACPNYGIITNIGKAHIEGFGSIENVIKTKTELFNYIENTEGKIFYNEQDEIIKNQIPKSIESYNYGISEAKIIGKLEKLTPFVYFSWQSPEYKSDAIQTNLVGDYNFTNFLLAISVGHYFKVSPQQINLALTNYKPTNNRSQVVVSNKNTIIVDCYNANPLSMTSAIKSFINIDNTNKVLILGDMLELGHIKTEEHQAIIDLITPLNYKVYLVGEIFKSLNSKYKSYLSIQDLLANENIKDINDSFILLKGSRGIKLEKLLDVL